MRTAWNVMLGYGRGLIAALQFLTRLPIPIQLPYNEQMFRRSAVFFPVAGCMIGLIIAGAGQALGWVVPAYVNAVLLVGIWVMLSGALHLDGLMDTADGLLSHRSRDRILEIMKDSRVGAMGVIVCILYLLLKFALLLALLEAGRAESSLALILIPMWSRTFMTAAIAGWPYVRAEQGLGQLFRTVRVRHALAAGLMALMLTGAAAWAYARIFPASALVDNVVWIGVIIAVTWIVGIGLAQGITRKLGGLTGDVYGAINELIEVSALLAVTMIWMQGVG